jgi:hypothetical protein
MPTITKHQLSGSTDGKQIAVTGTTTGASVTVHTATSTANTVDEVTITASNISASAVDLTLEIGGTTAAEQRVIEIPAKSMVTVVDRDLVLDNGAVINAFAGTADVINLAGAVNRIDQSA